MHGQPRVMSRRQQELPVIADDDDLGQMYLGLLRFVKPADIDEFTSAITEFYNRAYSSGEYGRVSPFFESRLG